MQKSLLLILVCCLHLSCQKGIHWDLVSAGSLVTDIDGNCLPVSVSGNYIAGNETTGDNFIIVDVSITTIGTYNIYTDSINGYIFKASGEFNSTGIHHVKLFCSGTPVTDGANNFTIHFNSSVCAVMIVVKSNAIPVAAFTLQGAPGKCMDDTLSGAFVKDFPLDTSNKIKIQVNVALPGTYSIKTDTVNGYSFAAVGTFDSAGIQTVILYAQGTPLNGGTDLFYITAGTSGCSFDVNTLPGTVTVTSDDYFPLTENSYWNYDDLFIKGNSINTMITGDSSINDKTYYIIEQTDGYGVSSQYFYRRDGADYLEYARQDKYTQAFQYSKSVFTDLLFLNQNVQRGDYWETPEFKDVTTFGQVLILKYGYSCLKTNAVIVINGNAFANVCIIEMRPQLRTEENSWGYTNEIYTCYYAKGVGLIYYKAVSNFSFTKAEMQLKSWLVK